MHNKRRRRPLIDLRLLFLMLLEALASTDACDVGGYFTYTFVPPMIYKPLVGR